MSDEEYALLMEVLLRQAPDLAAFVQRTGTMQLSRENILRVLDVLGWELCETGFDDQDEPNRRGQILEELIGRFSLAAQKS
jgi:hypothetical protein